MAPKSITVYDVNDNIITVLISKKDINAFLNGYLKFSEMDHYTTEY